MNNEAPHCQNSDSSSAARHALDILLHDIPEEQVRHCRLFLLEELERLYISARRMPPQWIRMIRAADDPRYLT